MILNDTSLLNPKGQVRLELYNEDGVFFTKEKKNLVVTSANEIVANMISNPAKVSRLTQEDNKELERTVNDEGHYILNLSIQPEIVKTTSQDVISTNEEKIFTIEGFSDVEEILSVKVGENELVVDQDVFILDAAEGKVVFEVAPKSVIEIKFQSVQDKQIKIIPGTEIIEVGGQLWKRGAVPSHIDNVYSINYKTGQVSFQNTVSDVVAMYDCLKQYGLGFMGLGGKPEGHLDHQPVSFSQTDKSLVRMNQEFDNSRVPIIYPSSIEEGKPELEVFPTKPIAFEEKTVTIVAKDDDLDQVIDSIYKIDDSGKKLIKLVSATKLAAEDDLEGVDEDLVIGEGIQIKDAAQATVEIVGELQENDTFEVVFQLQSSNLHLNYQLAMTPVVQLVSVVHENAATNKVTAYDIKDNGMKIGSGDVWMMNANAGIMQFNSNPSNGVPVNEPGQLTIEYKVNSGTVVKFIADFPKGTPGPIKLEKTDTFSSAGETTFLLSKTVSKGQEAQFEVLSVTRNGNEETYTVHADGTKVDVDNITSGDIVLITFKYLEDAHEVYQVAMFDENDVANSKMFNISGIGPVRKDKDTGMRITWSVTF